MPDSSIENLRALISAGGCLTLDDAHSEADIPSALTVADLMAALNNQLADNDRWNSTERPIGGDLTPTKETAVVAAILACLDDAQTAYRQNDFGKFMEHVLRGRLCLESHSGKFSPLVTGARDFSVGFMMRRILNMIGYKEEEKLCPPCLSCGKSRIDPEVVECATDKHDLVGKIRFSGSQNVGADARAFDPGNGVLHDDLFTCQAFVEWPVSRLFPIGSPFGRSHRGMRLRVA